MKKQLFLLLAALCACVSTGYSQAEGCPNAGQRINIQNIAEGYPEAFSTLTAAVEQAGLAGELAQTGPLNVFAPTNEAFDQLLTDLGITAEDLLEQKDLLRQILAYHVVVEGALCDSPLQGTFATLLPNNTLAVNGSTVVDGRNQRVNIIGNYPASNGQIFIIDGVLLPAPSNDGKAAPTMEALYTSGDWCMLPPDTSGSTGLSCMGLMQMYTYNATSGQCEEYTYGGCGSTLNLFNTLEECTAMAEQYCQ